MEAKHSGRKHEASECPAPSPKKMKTAETEGKKVEEKTESKKPASTESKKQAPASPSKSPAGLETQLAAAKTELKKIKEDHQNELATQQEANEEELHALKEEMDELRTDRERNVEEMSGLRTCVVSLSGELEGCKATICALHARQRLVQNSLDLVQRHMTHASRAARAANGCSTPVSPSNPSPCGTCAGESNSPLVNCDQKQSSNRPVTALSLQNSPTLTSSATNCPPSIPKSTPIVQPR